MTSWLDQFVDTKDKRYHLYFLITLAFVCLLLIPYVLLSFYLITLENYDSLYALLKEPIVNATWLSRFLLDVISLSSLTFINIFYTMLKNSYWYEIVALVLLIVAYPILERKKTTTFLMLLFIAEMIIASICILGGLSSGSLNDAIFYIRIIGFVLLIVNTIFSIIVIKNFIKQLHYYQNALQVQVIEVKDI